MSRFRCGGQDVSRGTTLRRQQRRSHGWTAAVQQGGGGQWGAFTRTSTLCLHIREPGGWGRTRGLHGGEGEQLRGSLQRLTAHVHATHAGPGQLDTPGKSHQLKFARNSEKQTELHKSSPNSTNVFSPPHTRRLMVLSVQPTSTNLGKELVQ